MSGNHGQIITPTHTGGTPVNPLNPDHIHLFTANLTGEQIPPSPTGSLATGFANLVFNETGDALEYTMTVSGLDFDEILGGTARTEDTGDDVTALHIYAAPRGTTGMHAFDILNPNGDDDLTFSFNSDGSVTLRGMWEETEHSLVPFAEDLRNAEPLEDVPLYINVHTERNPAGEIRGQVMGDLLQIGSEIPLSANPEFANSEGIVRSFMLYDENGVPLEVGMQFNEAALDPNNLPEELGEYQAGEFQIPLPHPDNETIFNLLTWTWVAGPNGASEDGHGPDGIYDVEHFDFHFYLNTQEIRDTIDVFDSPDEYAKAITLPPPGFFPEEYKRPIDAFGNAIGVAPGDGSHWDNAFGPEFKQPPPPTHYQFFEPAGAPFGPGYTIQYGAFDGSHTLLEPMVTPEFLRTKQEAQITIPQPDKYFKTGYFPNTYEIRYVEGSEFPYEVLLKDFVYHEASPIPQEANQAPTNIVLNNTTIYDNSGFLTLVGSLNTIDPHGPYNTVDDHVYALPFGIQGSGLIDDAGGRFFVNGNQIRVSEGAQLEAGETYQIVVRSVDTGGTSIQRPINISIEDLPEPTVTPPSEQQQILLQGTQAWNQFRTNNPGAIPDISGVDIPPIVNSNRGPTSFNLSGVNLSNTDLSGAILESVNLSNANLKGANLTGAFMFGANLSGTDLSGANLQGADLSGVNFTEANLSNANLSNAFLTAGANLMGANLSGANLSSANMITANLMNANLTGTNLTGASLRLNNVSGANLSNANLTNANLFGVDLSTAASTTGAILPENPPPPTEQQAVLLQGTQAWNQYRTNNPGAAFNLSGIDLPPIGFDLSGVNLSGVDLSNAFLEFVNLSGANLDGANLSGSRLFGANLTNASLNNAQLDDASLIGANLTDTNFDGADLSGVIFSGSTLDGTNFSNTDLTNAQFRFVNQSVSRLVALGEIEPVNFSNADLTDAKFRLAVLRDANFAGADLSAADDIYGADFTGANLESTQLEFGTQNGDTITVPTAPVTETTIVFSGDGEDLIDANLSSAAKDRFYGGADGDQIIAGTGDRVNGGSGDDILDASAGGGGNRLYGGGGSDELFAGHDDSLFGGEDNDILDAAAGSGNNRLYGGASDDLLIAGSNDVLIGGEGNDQLFVTEGGGNLLTGGAGVDQFWIVNGELPNGINTITDFELGTDVMSLGGLGLSFGDLTLTADGSNTRLAALGQDLAIINNIVNTNLSAANFAFG